MLNLGDIIGKFRVERTAFVLKSTQEDILGQKCPYKEKRTKEDTVPPLRIIFLSITVRFAKMTDITQHLEMLLIKLK